MAINIDDAREVLQRVYDVNNEEAPTFWQLSRFGRYIRRLRTSHREIFEYNFPLNHLQLTLFNSIDVQQPIILDRFIDRFIDSLNTKIFIHNIFGKFKIKLFTILI